MRDLEGADCFDVGQPEMVLQNLEAIGVSSTSTTDQWEINLVLTPQDATSFAKLTGSLAGQQLAIVVRDTVLATPSFTAPVTNGDVRIAGALNEEEAKRLAHQITG